MLMNNIVNRVIFLIGWLLSPLTFWNDIFVNIPLAYFAANILYYLTGIHFDLLVVGCYWASNFIGLVMMYISGKMTLVKGKHAFREAIVTLSMMVLYSILLIILARLGYLKPA